MKLVILFGSYRSESNGRMVVDYLYAKAREKGFDVEVADAKTIDLPMLDKRFSDYDGDAPENMTKLAQTLLSADAFIVVAGEYNHSIQPGLKNMLDHFKVEYQWRPVGIVGYSISRFAGVRVAMHLRALMGGLGMASIPNILGVGPVQNALNDQGQAIGDDAAALNKATMSFLNELEWFAQSMKAGRARGTPDGQFK